MRSNLSSGIPRRAVQMIRFPWILILGPLILLPLRAGVAASRAVAPAATKQDLAGVNADTMARSIADTGRIALYGIHFDTDKVEIKPESWPTIEQIARLMKRLPNLKLVIVGHTDNQGGLEYNMDLSTRRAKAVEAALIKGYGIQAGRLAAWGAGYLAPIASNQTKQGRAKNRRVELVEQ
jgi:OOP family OmpA-OmpF porin